MICCAYRIFLTHTTVLCDTRIVRVPWYHEPTRASVAEVIRHELIYPIKVRLLNAKENLALTTVMPARLYLSLLRARPRTLAHII